MVVLLGSQPLPWGLELLLTEGRDSILWSCFWMRSVGVGECLRGSFIAVAEEPLVTPAKAARGDVLALASCCPKARHGSAEQSARSGLAWSQLSVRLPEETMQKGREEGKVPFEK